MPAGPALTIPKEGLLPCMAEFGEGIVNHCARSGRPYDVAHVNFFMSGLAGLRLRKVFGVPLVITFHALGKVRRQHRGEDDGFPDARLPIEDMLIASADCIIAECPQDREDLITLYGADDRLIVTGAPFGVDLAERGPGDGHARECLGLAADEFVLLQLGRLVPRKGIDNVVWALLGFSHALHAELRPAGIKVTAVIAGGMRTPFLFDRFPDIDPQVLQMPETVARAVVQVLTLPPGSVIGEITVLPIGETSWP